ncbi:MAG TPA: extracellular solute-binding protein [Limnochordales bacterium]
MQNRRFPSVLVGVVLLVFAAFAMPAFASVEDAQREGKVVWYTVLATETAEEIAADFESRYGIEVEVVRDGAAPIFERYNRETAAGIANADVLESTNPGSFVYWQREGMLAPYDTPADAWIPDGMKHSGYWYTWRVSPIVTAYNTQLVSLADAPKSYRAFLYPQWRGQIVNGHPDYSGSVLTAIFALVQELGWEFFEQLAQQDVLLGASIHDGPAALLAGERSLSLMAEEYYAYLLRRDGAPIDVTYPAEGVPLVTAVVAIAHNAPHPNAARLFLDHLFSLETQQMFVDKFDLRVLHPGVTPQECLPRLADLKVIVPDPVAMMEHADEVRDRFVEIMGGR